MTDIVESEKAISTQDNSIPSKDNDTLNSCIKTETDHNAEETLEAITQETYLTPETLEKLTLGFLSHCLPDLQKAKGALTEILNNQIVLQETVQNENVKFKVNEVAEKTMAKARLYHFKLLYLKREMNNLADKSLKLKKRGIKLQHQKIKEELQKKEQEEKEKMREEMLTAKVAKKRSSSQSDKS